MRNNIKQGFHILKMEANFLFSRRSALKGVFAIACVFSLFLASMAFAHGNKSLVVFFSWSGNTRKVAEMIAKETGGSLLELKTVRPYPTGYAEVGAVAKKEWQENARPELSTAVPPDFANCKVIFIGYPVWNHTMPMPVYTFLEKHDFSGKIIAPFSTHMGDGLADGPEQIEKLCPGAKVLPGLSVSGNNVGNSQAEISKWLSSNHIL